MDTFEIPSFRTMTNSELRRMIGDLRLHRNMSQNLLARAETELKVRNSRVPPDPGLPRGAEKYKDPNPV